MSIKNNMDETQQHGRNNTSLNIELLRSHVRRHRALGLRAGALAVVTNGRVVTAHQPGEVSPLSLAAGDIHLMAVKVCTVSAVYLGVLVF